jgi:hypothetical protein
VFLVVLETALVDASVRPCLNTLAMLDVVNPVALVLGTGGLGELAISIGFIV